MDEPSRMAQLQQVTASLAEALTPDEVDRIIVEQAIATVGAYAGGLVLVNAEGTALHLVRVRNYSRDTFERWERFPIDSPVPIAEAARSREPVWLPTREEWAARYPHLEDERARSPSQALAALPLSVGERVLGALGLSFATAQPFAPAERTFMESLARHCAQALERARLYQAAQDELAQRARVEAALHARVAQQAAVAAFGEWALAEAELPRLLEHGAAIVAATLAIAYVGILELQPDGESLLLRAGAGWPDGLVGRVKLGADRASMAGYTMAVGEPVIMDDLSAETRFTPSGLFSEYGLVSGASVIVAGHERPYGVLGVYSAAPRSFGQDDVHFLQAIASLLGAAVARHQAERQRLELERKLLEAQKLESLGVLAGGIAHDFNNLLAVIIGGAHLALAEMAPESPARASVAGIERAAQQAAELTRQMLAYAGKGRILVESINLTRLIEETRHLLQASISKRSVLHYHLAPDLPAVEADAAQIRQVVINLVVNASEAIGERSGVIVVTTGATWADEGYLAELGAAPALGPGTYVTLEVGDTGEGMDAATQARIFEPFFTTKFSGRGLGLAAVQGIVRRHRGALRVYSEPGRGTTMRILLPQSGRAAAHAPGAAPSLAEYWSGTALVVDDEPEVRGLLARMLERLGLVVLTAADGREGVALFRGHAGPIDCVFLDLTMPHLNGEETFRELRRISPQVRVVAMSGYTEEEVLGRFAGKGLAGFLAKPFTPKSLLDVMRVVLPRGEG